MFAKNVCVVGITIAIIIIAMHAMRPTKQEFVGPISIVADSVRRPDREPYVSLPVASDTYSLPSVFNGIFNRIPVPEITHKGLVALSNRRADELSLAGLGL